MIEPLLERIRELEKSNRCWKTTSLVLGLILLAILSTGSVFMGFQGYRVQIDRERAMRARDEALMQEARARAEAEAALQAQQKANKE